MQLFLSDSLFSHTDSFDFSPGYESARPDDNTVEVACVQDGLVVELLQPSWAPD